MVDRRVLCLCAVGAHILALEVFEADPLAHLHIDGVVIGVQPGQEGQRLVGDRGEGELQTVFGFHGAAAAEQPQLLHGIDHLVLEVVEIGQGVFAGAERNPAVVRPVQDLQLQRFVSGVLALHQTDDQRAGVVDIGPAIPVGIGSDIGSQLVVGPGRLLLGRSIADIGPGRQNAGVGGGGRGQLLLGEGLQGVQGEGLVLPAVPLLIDEHSPLGPGHLVTDGQVLLNLFLGVGPLQQSLRQFPGGHVPIQLSLLTAASDGGIFHDVEMIAVQSLHCHIAVQAAEVKLLLGTQCPVGRIGAQHQGSAGGEGYVPAER